MLCYGLVDRGFGRLEFPFCFLSDVVHEYEVSEDTKTSECFILSLCGPYIGLEGDWLAQCVTRGLTRFM